MGIFEVDGDCIHAGTLQAMLIEVPLRRFQDALYALGIAWPPALRLWRGIWVHGHGRL